MVSKNEMTTAVTELEQELSGPSGEGSSKQTESDESGAAEPRAEAREATEEDVEPRLQDVEHLLEEHGLDLDDISGIWDHFLKELKDLPSKKPLVTVFGAFLLGFLAGRSSRK